MDLGAGTFDPGRLFADREDAGARLAPRLVASLDLSSALLLGIPRGGVVTAGAIARRLRLPLAVAPVATLGVPWQPELKFGAIDVEGEETISASTVALAGLTDAELLSIRDHALQALERWSARWGASPSLADRTVILVEDGLTSGLAMRAAVRLARRRGAARVVAATPCASPDAVAAVAREADRVVALVVEPAFGAVSEYYHSYHPVSDEQLGRILTRG